MDKQEQIKTIEAYLLGKMAPVEKDGFEQRMAEEPGLLKQVEDYQILLKGIQVQGMRDLLNTIKDEMDQENKEGATENKRDKSYSRKWLVAASIALFGGIITFLYLSRTPNEKLFDSYYYKDPGLPTIMGNTRNLAFVEAMTDYKLGNYGDAIREWKTLLENNPGNDTLNYFLGVGYLANGEVEKSMPYLKNVAAMERSMFIDEAHFYLGLLYLRANDVDKARKNLQQSALQESKKLLTELHEK